MPADAIIVGAVALALSKGGEGLGSMPAKLVVNPGALAGVRPELTEFFRWWNEQGPFPIKITEGVRSNARQAELYAQGRTTAGPIVTNASSSSSSAHGHAAAVDAYPWEGGALVLSEVDPRWKQYGSIAESWGFTWGGRWTSPVDRPHIEIKGWQSLPVVA